MAGLLAYPTMLAIFLHLMVNAVVPLTVAGAWRGPRMIAVLFYLSGYSVCGHHADRAGGIGGGSSPGSCTPPSSQCSSLWRTWR